MNQYGILAIFLLILQCNCAKKLIFSTLVFRHGERERYNPKIPSTDCHKHLLNIGMRQQHISGRYFRSRYVEELDLLPENHDLANLYFRSTYLSRTINSAVSFFSGLYHTSIFSPLNPEALDVDIPIKSQEKEEYSELWTPNVSPVHMLKKNEDSLLFSYKSAVCPSLKALKKQKWMTDKAKDLEEGDPVISEGKADFARSKVVRVYKELADNPDLVRLATHNILKQIINYMRLALIKQNINVGKREEEIIQDILRRDPSYQTRHKWRMENLNASDLRLLVYSSHDTMVVALVNALGIRMDTRVTVASTMSIELYIDPKTKSQYVDVQLNKESLKIPGCHGICTLKQFAKTAHLYGMFPSDKIYEKKCRSSEFLQY